MSSELALAGATDASAGAAGDALTSLRLGDADVLAGVALSDAAGWNQTADDWALFVRHGRVHGRRSANSELVATAATLPLGPSLAWISMVLVARAWQHRGLATQLLDACVDDVVLQRRTPVLDATPAGEAVYRRLGFGAGFGFSRWAGDAMAGPAAAVAAAAAAHGVRTAGPDDLALVGRLDRAASGLERGFWLRDVLARQGTRAWLASGADGLASSFALLRRGRHAMQLGPVVAADPAQALALVGTALASATGRVYLDVPDHQGEVTAWLATQGYAVQRPFRRMAKSDVLPACVVQPSARLFAVAGPEFG